MFSNSMSGEAAATQEWSNAGVEGVEREIWGSSERGTDIQNAEK